MGKKEGDLWDDSALINAFDNAMTTYKKMHKPNQGSTEEDKLVTTPGEEVIVEANKSEEAKRIQGDADDLTKDIQNTTEMGETSNLSEVKENHCSDSYVPDPYSQDVQDMQNNYSYSQGGEDYTKLLNQYYEIEEKRQKILEQLHQFGGGNYQYSGEGSGFGQQWGASSGYEQNAVPASQSSNPAVVSSCCPYMYPCLTTSCAAFPACSSDWTCPGISCTEACLATSTGKPLSLEDGKIVKTAFGTAERALSSMKAQLHGDSSISEVTEKKDEKDEAELAETTSSEPDISVVLNAWYSAGFYTGKYLVEQSIAKKRPS